ncbi:MAG: hypothetical protein ACE5GV_03840 [Candidatus Scalindua sp.]
MPITEELNNIRKLESVGFSHEQAETLADVIEKAQVNGQESLKEFIGNENKNLRNEMKGIHNELKLLIAEMNKDISGKIGGLEVRMVTSQKDMLIKIFGIIVGTVGIAVTILKLFP